MGMTMTQKILAAAAGLDKVEAGQLIEADLDLVLGNDITSPVAIHEMDKMTVKNVFDKDKIALVMDHFIPNKDNKSAEHCKCVREFACKNEITNYFDVGEMGIEHALLPEKGLTVAGDVVIGADSHTCTYGALGAFSTGVGSTDMAAGMATGKAWFKVPSAIKFNIVGKPAKWVSGKDVILHIIGMIGVDGALYKSMEFVGEGIKNLSMDDRFTIANMAIEAGGKNGIFPVDEQAVEYMKEHSKRPYKVYEADADAVYDEDHRGCCDRPVCDRFLYQRQDRGPSLCSRDLKGPQSEKRCALYHYTCNTKHLSSGNGGRASENLYRSRRCCQHSYLRTMPGRIYGNPGRRRALYLHHKQKLCGTYGTRGL